MFMSSDDEIVILSESESEEEYQSESEGSSSSGSPTLPTNRRKRKSHDATNISHESAATRTRSKKKRESIIVLSSSDDESGMGVGDDSFSASSDDDECFYTSNSLANRCKNRRDKKARSSSTACLNIQTQHDVGGEKDGENAHHRSITPTNADDNEAIEQTSSSLSSSSSASITMGSITLASVPRSSRSVPLKNSKVTQRDCTSYIKTLEKSIKRRIFPLTSVPDHEVVSTGRTIKPLKGWAGHWPALREFLQNTVDHLSLMDGKTGRRRACLDIHVKKDSHGAGDDEVTTISFICQDKKICEFVVLPHELIIEQAYTYPIASRAMDTGVVDTTKSSNSAQAGGFGDGFKTAATALIANSKGKDFNSLKWSFYAIPEKTKLTWSFEGLTKESVATFAKCQVLQVVIDKCELDDDDLDSIDATNPSRDEYVMRQSIKVKNIGKSFLEIAVPRFAVFWDLDEQTLISTQRNNARGLGGDFLGPALNQPKLFGGQLGNIRPQSGIYVRGIWVRKSKIKDALMCFYGNRLEVIGRDRNDVDEDDLLAAVTYVLKNCNDLNRLEELLSPLRHVGPTKKGGRKTDSWILKPATYFNRIIEREREFILYNVLRIPQGSIFISNKTKSPFFSWASGFLRKHGTPLIPIEKGANKYLFEEVNEYQLTERCVQILKDNAKGKRKGSKDVAQSVIRKFLIFLGMGALKVVPSKDVALAFSHDQSLYIPESKLNRDRIVMIVNVCHSKYEGAAENYSSLVQALVETLPATKGYECSIADADKVLKKAKMVMKEASDFLRCYQEEEDTEEFPEVQQPQKPPSRTTEFVDIDAVDKSQNISGPKRNTNNDIQVISSPTKGINEDIKAAVNRKKTKRKDDNANLTGGAFAADNAGDDHCIRPSSDLTDIQVDESLGGGSMLFDREVAVTVQNKSFPRTIADKIVILRQALDEASRMVLRSIPSTRELLDTIRVGYDGKNNSYEAFCDGSRIVVNLFACLPKAQGLESPSRSLVHDFVITITHELAHMLKPDAGHGPTWRDTHMKMVISVMNHLQPSST